MCRVSSSGKGARPNQHLALGGPGELPFGGLSVGPHTSTPPKALSSPLLGFTLWPPPCLHGRLLSECSRLPQLPGSGETLTPAQEKGQSSYRLCSGVPGDHCAVPRRRYLLAETWIRVSVWLGWPQWSQQSPGWKQTLIMFYDSTPTSLLQGALQSYMCANHVFLGLRSSLTMSVLKNLTS